jgi:TolB-like protein/Tfp pilus assembly protein PilF
MKESKVLSSPIRFGLFEADLHARELRKDGVKVKLQEQPLQVLGVLLEQAGQVVTRDELQRKIWATDTFVDFERGLNKAISRLRDALGDSADSPRFIETLPRRGYRFIARVVRRIDSVAVLPFENLSGDSNQEHWADGMTDELITRIAGISGLRVISRTSIMRFKDRQIALPEIARQLSVDAVIEGSVALTDRKMRIRVKLIDGFSDRHLWADTYERELGDVLTLQGQIAQAIAGQVRAQLAPEEQAILARVRPARPSAYEAYLKGRFFWNKRTEADLNRGLEYFNHAVALDPAYALAHAGLADSYELLGILGLLPPKDAFPKAKSAAETALSLDETLAETHTALAHLRMIYDWDWGSAEHEFNRALQLNANYSIAHLWYGNLLTILRRFEEAIAEVTMARELDPLSLPVNTFVGFVYMRARQYDRAIAACREAIELEPSNPFGHWILARVFDAQNELRESLSESERAATLSGNCLPFTAHLGYAYARTGDRVTAQKIIDDLKRLSQKKYVSPYAVAVIYVGLGETDSAFEWLEKAFADRAARLSELEDPPFDNLRLDPRFQDLVRRVGLPS